MKGKIGPSTGRLIPRPSLTARPWGVEATFPTVWSPLPGSAEYQAQGQYSTTGSLYQLLPRRRCAWTCDALQQLRLLAWGGRKEHPRPRQGAGTGGRGGLQEQGKGEPGSQPSVITCWPRLMHKCKQACAVPLTYLPECHQGATTTGK